MSALVSLQSPADLGPALKARRNSRAIKQDQLASVVDISRYTLVDLERGKSDPRLSTILKLAGALGLTLALVPRELDLQTRVGEDRNVRTGEEIELDGLENIEVAWKGE